MCLFIPLGYAPGPRPGTIAPVYPVGPPLHFAAAAWFLGWDFGPFVVSPLAAVVSLLLLYLVAREIGLSRASGFSCAVTVERADLAAGSVEAMSFEARGERIL